MKTKVIAISNQKGGVAKTTTASAMAAALRIKGFRVLAVDLDPQGNLSDSSGAEMYESLTVYDVLKGNSSASEAIQQHAAYDIIPSNIMLAGADQEFSHTGKEYMLRETLEPIEKQYDYIILDTPPSLGILTVNAFTFADEVIIPTTAGIYAANGIQQLNNTILNVKKYCNSKIKIAGILITRYNPRTNISKSLRDITEKLGQHISAKLYNTYIRNSVVVEEAQATKSDIFSYSDKSTVAEDYMNFIEEYLK